MSRLTLENLANKHGNFLHPREQSYFCNLHGLKCQESYLRGRYCAKQAISACLIQKEFSKILIENGVFGQPIVYYPTPENLQVSLSHTNTLAAALAFPEAHPMAIDVETINIEKSKIIQRRLTDKEQRLLSAFSDNIPLQLLWTMKEALSKVLKCGLTISFDLLEIESFRQQGNLIKSHFKNFNQYQALSFLTGEAACSVVCSQNTELTLDVLSIKKTIG